MTTILIPLPSRGFDPSEAAIPWKILSNNNIKVVFATPNGKIAHTDEIMLTGKGLGIWKLALAARKDAVDAFNEMVDSSEFQNPITYQDINMGDFDGILLPGGHDKPVKEYLESTVLQKLISYFFNVNKPVAAICHGVVLVARSKNSSTGQSVIYKYKTTSLLASQEMLGYNMTRLWMGDYYLTYPEITVEDEVLASIQNKDNFIKGPFPILRDDMTHLSRGFVVRDRNYLSARWPGDVYKFATEFVRMLKKH